MNFDTKEFNLAGFKFISFSSKNSSLFLVSKKIKPSRIAQDSNLIILILASKTARCFSDNVQNTIDTVHVFTMNIIEKCEIIVIASQQGSPTDSFFNTAWQWMNGFFLFDSAILFIVVIEFQCVFPIFISRERLSRIIWQYPTLVASFSPHFFLLFLIKRLLTFRFSSKFNFKETFTWK